MASKKKTSKPKKIAREIFEIVFALVVAWLGYQALALATGTPLPIVAVVSDSMFHDKPFDEWWLSKSNVYEGLEIGKEEFSKLPFPNGLSKGDLIFVINQKPKIGDVVIYQRDSITIIHRVIQIREGGYIIRGDNNQNSDEGGNSISSQRIRGKAVFAVPVLGFPRTLIFEVLRV